MKNSIFLFFIITGIGAAADSKFNHHSKHISDFERQRKQDERNEREMRKAFTERMLQLQQRRTENQKQINAAV